MSVPGLEITELHIPATVDAADAADFRAVCEYAREIRRVFLGTSGRDFSDESYRVAWTTNELQRQQIAVGRVDGGIVGWFVASFPLVDNGHLVWTAVRVRLGFEGRGYGTALAAELHRRAAQPGRTTAISSTFHNGSVLDAAADRIAPTSGNGFVPADDHAVRFARAQGYALEQVNRTSVTDPRSVDLAGIRAAAETRAGAGYRLVQWHSRTPLHLRGDMAHLYNRMSVDEPLGGLAMEEALWDAERIAETEARIAEEGREQWITAVDFAGTLVAFTVLYTDVATPAFADQEETLVLSEHRGRSLGLLVKAANAQYLLDHRPEVREFITWNAAENEHMLAINDVFGFHPSGGSGVWQRVLA